MIGMPTAPDRHQIGWVQLAVLKALDEDPSASTRDIAAQLGLRLDRVNHAVTRLIERGLLNKRDVDHRVMLANLGTVRLGQSQVRILALLGEVGEGHTCGIAREIGTSPGATRRAILGLLERGLIVESTEVHPDRQVRRQWRLARAQPQPGVVDLGA